MTPVMIPLAMSVASGFGIESPMSRSLVIVDVPHVGIQMEVELLGGREAERSELPPPNLYGGSP
jgi:hypothetical protein